MPDEEPPRARRSVLGQFALLALTWGASFLFIKVGLRELSPAQVVAGRLVSGAAALALISVVSKARLPRSPRVWAHLAVLAVLLCLAPFLLFAWAEQHVSSGLASIYNATTPLMTTAVALAVLPAERPTAGKLAGLGLGFLGVLVVLAPWRGVGRGAGLAQAACLAATACYGVAFVYLRRFISPRGLGAVPVATVQVGLAALLMLVAAPLYASAPPRLSWPAVASIAALGVLGTGIAYAWNTNVVTGWGATNASTVTYLTPVVGVALGAVVLGEHVGWNEPTGALIVIAGIALAQGRLRPLRGRAAQPPPPRAGPASTAADHEDITKPAGESRQPAAVAPVRTQADRSTNQPSAVGRPFHAAPRLGRRTAAERHP